MQSALVASRRRCACVLLRRACQPCDGDRAYSPPCAPIKQPSLRAHSSELNSQRLRIFLTWLSLIGRHLLFHHRSDRFGLHPSRMADSNQSLNILGFGFGWLNWLCIPHSGQVFFPLIGRDRDGPSLFFCFSFGNTELWFRLAQPLVGGLNMLCLDRD